MRLTITEHPTDKTKASITRVVQPAVPETVEEFEMDLAELIDSIQGEAKTNRRRYADAETEIENFTDKMELLDVRYAEIQQELEAAQSLQEKQPEEEVKHEG